VNGAVACTTEQALLGEGARWDDRRAELLRVDIVAGRVFRDRVAPDGALERVREYEVPGTVGAIAPIHGDDGWILAAGRGFVHLQPDGTQRRLLDVAPPGTRMNDAACDPQGRMWAGCLADDHRDGGGALYRLGPDGRTELVLDGMTIPNGLGWSPDGRTMYLIDSGPRVLLAFDFDGQSGTITSRRELVTLGEDEGAPDGMTVDAAGDLWVAVYGGGQVRRYTPAGTLVEVRAVPAEQSTSCAFGGPGMSTLYVTTATENWTEEQRRQDPAAGLTYQLSTTSAGHAAAAFRPDPRWWSRSQTEPDPVQEG
jgi:sugar lactone lactonase YvrE